MQSFHDFFEQNFPKTGRLKFDLDLAMLTIICDGSLRNIKKKYNT